MEISLGLTPPGGRGSPSSSRPTLRLKFSASLNMFFSRPEGAYDLLENSFEKNHDPTRLTVQSSLRFGFRQAVYQRREDETERGRKVRL